MFYIQFYSMSRRVVYVMVALSGLLGACLAVWLITSTADAAEPLSTVTVQLSSGQGAVRGNYDQTAWTNQTFMQFRGIPYAEAPVGELRFRSSVARAPWSETYDALDFGQRCPVISHLNMQTSDSRLEDCLNLCVYTKHLSTRQPVMFYIYGGGYYNGSAEDHPPHYLLERDIVLVVPQYRIGALGWLTSFTEELPGNAPIADVLLSLDWVQKHIERFGGDPTQVTIVGQSAGSAVASALLLSPRSADQHFQRAIVQSGSVFAIWAIATDPVAQARRICIKLGCQQCEQHEQLLRCVRGAPVLQLLKATEAESFSPVAGDLLGILPQRPEELLKGYKRDVPLLTGFTQHDGSFVLAMAYDSLLGGGANVSALSVRQLSKSFIDMAKDATGLSDHLLYRLLYTPELLNSNRHKEALPAYFDLTSIIFMKSPVISLASKLLTRQPTAPVYVYSFEYEGQHTRFGYELGNSHYPFNGGVHHSNDNIYLFATHSLQGEDVEMAQNMVEVWTSFVISGVPKDLKALTSPSGPYNRLNLQITHGNDLLETLTATIDDPDNERLQRDGIEFLV